jgi:hypothetical protein
MKKILATIKKIVRIGLLGIALFSSVSALAVPITVTATGQITNSRDDLNIFGLGTGSNTILGASITAIWTFDTDNSGPDTYTDSQQANYSPGTDWIDSSLNIDTNTVDSTFSVDDLITDEDQFVDRLLLQHDAHGGTGYDSYWLRDRGQDQSSNEHAYSHVEIYSWVDDFMTSLDPEQTLSWSAGDYANDVGFGRFQYYDGGLQSSYGIYTLDTFIVTSGAGVPAPSSLLLFGIALSGLWLRLRKKTH